MTAVEVLKAARAKIEPKGAWCQGHIAKARNGEACNEHSPDACQWCIAGALWTASRYDHDTRERAFELVREVVALHGYERTFGVAKFNDAPGRTQAEVLTAFDKAIELAEKK